MMLVLTNMPDAASANVLAQQLVQARAAACVNLLAPCTSVYRWNNEIETAAEIPLLIKTTRVAYPRVEELIRTAHPYELPEIIALPVTAALTIYGDWVNRETRIVEE